MIAVGVGDAAAALCGRAVDGVRIRGQKTIAGLVANIIAVALTTALVTVW